jgi:hypothetical protein
MANDKLSAIQNPAEYHEFVSGNKGFRKVTSSSDLDDAEYYRALYVKTDASITGTNHAGGDDLSEDSYTAGSWIFGLFRGDTLAVASGTLDAYIA